MGNVVTAMKVFPAMNNTITNTDDMYEALEAYRQRYDEAADVQIALMARRAFFNKIESYKIILAEQYGGNLTISESNDWVLQSSLMAFTIVNLDKDPSGADSENFHSSDLNEALKLSLAEAIAHAIYESVRADIETNPSTGHVYCKLSYNHTPGTYTHLIKNVIKHWKTMHLSEYSTKEDLLRQFEHTLIAEEVRTCMERRLGVIILATPRIPLLDKEFSNIDNQLTSYETLCTIREIVHEVIHQGISQYSVSRIELVEFIAEAIAGIAVRKTDSELYLQNNCINDADIRKYYHAIVRSTLLVAKISDKTTYVDEAVIAQNRMPLTA